PGSRGPGWCRRRCIWRPLARPRWRGSAPAGASTPTTWCSPRILPPPTSTGSSRPRPRRVRSPWCADRRRRLAVGCRRARVTPAARVGRARAWASPTRVPLSQPTEPPEDPLPLLTWRRHGDGQTIAPGAVVAPDERLSWPRTIGIGMQHVVAMFGATFLVPLLTGLPPATTLFFSAIGTVAFLLITGNRLPSYLGSSFAFIAPILAATGSHGVSSALGGVVIAGALLAVVGLVVHLSGTRWIDAVMPPVVTGTIVALIGFNLAPAAWGSCDQEVVDGAIVETCTSGVRAAPVTALVTILAIVLVTVLFRGILGRLSILVGVVVGYVVATVRGEVDFTAVGEAAWFGLPTFTTPTFTPAVLGLFVPVVLVLVAENVGHVKSVAAMTGAN